VQEQQSHAGQAPFHFFIGEVHSRGNCACGGKIDVTPAAACSRERALLAHATEGVGHAGGCSALGRACRRR
jgi:hypothetical protein